MKIGSFRISLERDPSREEKIFADLSPEERERLSPRLCVSVVGSDPGEFAEGNFE